MKGGCVLPVSHACEFILIYLGTGLASPVLSLMLLARGASLGTLPLMVGVTTAVTCLCEVPSGIAADALGRRRVFILAMALQIAAFAMLLSTPGLITVVLSSALRGLALAARSGTLEAIEIDRVVSENPDAADRLRALDALNGRLALLESAGVGMGAVVGGVVAALDSSYALLILCIAAVGAGALAGGFLLYPPDACESAPIRERLHDTLLAMRASLFRPGDMRLVLAASASVGMAMIAVETYGQLVFEGLVGRDGIWMLGLINCAGMGAAALGSTMAMNWGSAASSKLGVAGRRGLYMLLQMMALACSALFSAVASAAGFIVVYMAFYLALGMRSVIEQTVLHNAVPSKERSGMASVQSLALRAGGLVGSAVSGPIIAALSLAAAWPAIAALAAAMALLGNGRARAVCRKA